jgi:glucose 1-dehydrogenase
VVVNISSVHEYLRRSGHDHYCAAKAGLKLLMETAVCELDPEGIRLVNVAPGATLTAMNAYALQHPGARARIAGWIPLGRMAKPDDIAAAVAWLASDEAAYATGTTVVIGGGLSLSPR